MYIRHALVVCYNIDFALIYFGDESYEFEVKMAEGSLSISSYPFQDPQLSQSLDATGDSDIVHIQAKNGHVAGTPDESFSPTSVIYFKEALSSANIRFAKTGLSSPTPVQYEFNIERMSNKTKSEFQ